MQTPFREATVDQKRRSIFGNFEDGCSSGGGSVHASFSEADQTEPGFAAASLQEQIDAAISRGFIYRFLAKAFETPTKKGWKWLCDAHVKEMLRLALHTLIPSQPNPFTGPANQLLSTLRLRNFAGLESAYLIAFGHTVRGDCPMNEIEYGDIKADPLFQPHRLADLAAFYSAFGLEITEDAAERQDHICIELEFMSVLSMKEAYALENQLDPEQLSLCREAQKKFLHEHLARWVPAFTRRLARIAGDGPLGAIADFSRCFIAFEAERADVTPGSDDLMLRPIDENAERLCESCGIQNLPPGALRSI